ncbi:hypothetical protein U1Q18_025372 [Sarracenia purpurea var. burkii]
MLGPSHLTPAATPALRALKLSLIPILHFSSSSSSSILGRMSTFAPSHTLLSKTLITTSPHLPSIGFNRVPAVVAHLCPKAAASFSGGSSSGGSREILVQHLLVKEGDLKLLLELQKRILEGWSL